MPVMPGNVSKGLILQRLDDYVNASQTNASNLLGSLKPDEAEPGLAELAASLLIAVDPAVGAWKSEEDHLGQDWFSTGADAWWREHQPIENVVAKGIEQAVRLCLFVDGDPTGAERPTPFLLDSYWVCAGHSLEVTSMVKAHESGGQVTMLIMTPSPEDGKHRGSDPGDFANLEDIWTAKRIDYGPGQEVISSDVGKRFMVARMKTRGVAP